MRMQSFSNIYILSQGRVCVNPLPWRAPKRPFGMLKFKMKYKNETLVVQRHWYEKFVRFLISSGPIFPIIHSVLSIHATCENTSLKSRNIEDSSAQYARTVKSNDYYERIRIAHVGKFLSTRVWALTSLVIPFFIILRNYTKEGTRDVYSFQFIQRNWSNPKFKNTAEYSRYLMLTGSQLGTWLPVFKCTALVCVGWRLKFARWWRISAWFFVFTFTNSMPRIPCMA